MAKLSPTAVRLLAVQQNVAHRAQLIAAGLHTRTISRLLEDGLLVAVHHRVYRLAGFEFDEAAAARAACLASRRVVLAGTCAGRRWGLRRVPDLGIEVISEPPTLVLPGVTVHTTNSLPPSDVVRRSDGLCLTSVPRTLFDLAAVLSDADLTSAIEHALERRLVSVSALAAIGDRLGGRGREGTVRFGRVLASRHTDAAVGSHLELRVERAIQRAGIGQPLRQHQIRLEDGTSIRVDFYWPAEGVILEVDHRYWHADAESVRRDKERDRATARLGSRRCG